MERMLFCEKLCSEGETPFILPCATGQTCRCSEENCVISELPPASELPVACVVSWELLAIGYLGNVQCKSAAGFEVCDGRESR